MKFISILLSIFILSINVCAIETVDIIESSTDVYSFIDKDIVFPEYTEKDPLPVMLIESEEDFDNVRVLSRSAPVVVIGDEQPDDLLFYGSGWITGTDSSLGRVTLYFPISYKSGYWGVDRNGYLFNVSSSSISGYLEDAYNNSVSASGFSYPRYRTSNSSYDYVTLYLRPENSNMEIAVQSAPLYSSSDLLPYVSIFLLGVIIVCFMKRS